MLAGLLRRLGLAEPATAGDTALAGEAARGHVVESPPPPSAEYRGYLEELSDQHIYGWVHDLAAPGRRLECEAVLSDTNEVVVRVMADQFGHGLSHGGVGDGAHAFWARVPRPLSEAERARLVVRVVGTDFALVVSSHLNTRYEPVLHVAMDIVDNCNLRCPFCLYDYSTTRTTNFMSEDTLLSALRLLPYTRDGQFWFSCLHEPTLHPRLIEFVEHVPLAYRRKLFFTTNLAKRMPAAYFDWLAGNGMDHVNISIESLDPAIYERMRKGARFRIFQENWDLLMGSLDRASQPTRIRYIAMAYKSNLRELPGLARHLLEERRGWQVEIRYTFDVPFIPPEFRSAEFLDEGEWVWLAEQLADYPADRVVLVRPPIGPPPDAPATVPAEAPADAAGTGATDAGAVLPGRYLLRLSWDGTLRVRGTLASSRYDNPVDRDIATFDVHDIQDPPGCFDEFLDRAG